MAIDLDQLTREVNEESKSRNKPRTKEQKSVNRRMSFIDVQESLFEKTGKKIIL